MKIIFALLLSLSFQFLHAQELFVYTEPASNMAAKSIGVRANNFLMKERFSSQYNYQFIPEIMWGVSKRTMIHVEGFLSNRNNRFKFEGGALYVKYRFYSEDEVHSHFRMAAYARGALNKSEVQQPAIDLNGYNSGYETGIVATKLISKLALSANASFLHATDNGSSGKFQFDNNKRDAIGYSLSVGRLLLPRNYVNYEQTNFNTMLEILGQTNLGSGKSYLDVAPSIQFIFLSKMRLDLGYRIALVKDLNRMEGNSFLLRLEYNLFNVYK